MTELRARTRPSWLDTLVVSSATAGLVVAATFVMFSAFMFYDDEGYVILSLRNYAGHGGLYRDVYTQYGPFPFVLYHALQAIGVPLTHTIGRLITIGAWTATALACATLAGRATRSLIARVSVLAAVFLYLWVMANEPTHPGSIIIVLTSLLALFGYTWIAAEKFKGWSIFGGAVTAALLLTKINIGIFVAFSACAWWLLHHRNDNLRRWAMVVVSGCAIVMPLVLMRPLLSTPWVQTYALVFACSGTAVALGIAVGATARVGGLALRQGLLAGGVIGGLVLAAIFLSGTSASDLLDGVVLAPMRQPTSFSVRFAWPAGMRVIAVGSLIACVAAWALKHRYRSRVDLIVAMLRLLSAAALAVNILRFPAVSPDYLVFGSALPCLWIFAWPLAGENSLATAARAWVVLLLLGQCLHVFPVPGSQIAWGSLLALPLAAIGAWDAAKWLVLRSSSTKPMTRIIAPGCSLLVLAFTITTAWKFGELATRYREGQNLGLPGAELIRIPDDSAALHRLLTHNAAAHADVLFSLPGMFSFNLWSGVPPPTHANVTHWFTLLDEAQQASIKRNLESNPRACVIVQRAHLEFLHDHRLTPKGPLYEFIKREFESAFTVGDVEFCVRRGRRIKPFMVAELLTRPNSSAHYPSESTLLTFTLLLPPARPVSSIQIRSGSYSTTLLELSASNARVEFSPVDGRGEQSGPRRPMSWPLQISAAGTLWIYYNGETMPRPAREATIVLRTSENEEVGLARLSAP